MQSATTQRALHRVLRGSVCLRSRPEGRRWPYTALITPSRGRITRDDAWNTALGGAVHGVLAEYHVFDQNGLVRIPNHLSYAEGSTLPCAGVTAWNAFYGLKALQLGQTVLTLGTGGVSVFAIQFAHAAGARVLATSSSENKLAKVGSLGASVAGDN
jgi:NADPH:quinone reductase-like Zn-dependent oxidoreductase